ncbi:hydroxyacid dehydrogenase [Orrella daihaiensis]|uniref:Hydroxyacid dehydrogenase n=1 Tax=Orrella daihaiensis TaxID=2782176 RepID=A0ABY4AJL7_9BURK|nr:hydroxyacid dehydrogenase [Orrella daihaiensis]UOD49856.1 hydroxyacid dehydrogenase [Orrella daihaiensis]
MQAQLVRFNFWLDPVFDQIVQANPHIKQTLCQFEDADEQSWAVMAKAHAYHICAARDEVPPQWQVTSEFLARTPELLCVSSSGAGFDPVDVAACTKHGVLVLNQSGCNSNSVAEHTFALLLALRHRVGESERVMRSGNYGSREDLMGNEIQGLTLGIVGVGNIGSRVAEIARVFGMQVLGCDPYVDRQELVRRGVEPVGLDELINRSDVVTLHCPRNHETLNLFNAERFAQMRSGAIFLSTARGGIHDEDALADALATGHLSGAGLDVWTVEPPAADNPLLTMENVVATYHTAGVTHEARRNAARMGAEQLCNLFTPGRAPTRPPRLINPEAWPLFEKRFARFMSGSGI